MNKIYTTPRITSIIKSICDQDIASGRKKRFDWHYLYVISNIRLRHILDRRFQKDDYAPINMELLRTLVSQSEAETIIKRLISNNIIETDNIIIRGIKSRGYRLTETYREDKWKLSEIKDLKLVVKLTKKQEEANSKIAIHGKGYQIANYWLGELKINERQAKRYIKTLTTTEKENETYLNTVELIYKRDFFRTVDKTAGRFHNNLTNISTPLRQYLSIDGEELWGTDLTSSQPVFMAILMKDIPTVDKQELERFTKCVCDGQFYEYIAEQGGLDIDLNDYAVRKDFKQKIFGGCLFDRNRRELSKWEKVFYKSFPTILEAARDIKKTDYNSFAIMLQKAEAKFFFRCVEQADKIIGKGIAPLLAIHDSIVSTKEYIDMVQQIIEVEFEAQFELTPQLKTTKL